MPTNDATVPRIPDLTSETVEAVNAVALRMQLVDGIDSSTIDVPDILTALARVAESRFVDGDDKLAIALLDVAALALLWYESADGFAVLLSGAQAGDCADERSGESA